MQPRPSSPQFCEVDDGAAALEGGGTDCGEPAGGGLVEASVEDGDGGGDGEFGEVGNVVGEPFTRPPRSPPPPCPRFDT
jgi:hypothetical protein